MLMLKVIIWLIYVGIVVAISGGAVLLLAQCPPLFYAAGVFGAYYFIKDAVRDGIKEANEK